MTVYDVNNCSATASVTITEPAVLTANINPKTDVSCNGGTRRLSMVNASGGTAPYLYLWSNGSTDKTATNLAAGIYTVTVTDDNNCTTTVSVTITQPTMVNVVIGSIVDADGAGGDDGSAKATASGGTGPYDFFWSNGFNPTRPGIHVHRNRFGSRRLQRDGDRFQRLHKSRGI